MSHAIYNTAGIASLSTPVWQVLNVLRTRGSCHRYHSKHSVSVQAGKTGFVCGGALVLLNEAIIIIVGVMRTKITRGKIGIWKLMSATSRLDLIVVSQMCIPLRYIFRHFEVDAKARTEHNSSNSFDSPFMLQVGEAHLCTRVPGNCKVISDQNTF